MRKARAGVEVRLLYDAVGSWNLSQRFVRRLRQAGIDVRVCAPLRFPWFTPRANRRNHSKIAVIDGRTGFVGGINIAERYLDGNALGRWRDEHLRIEGEAVADLQRLFAADWALEGGGALRSSGMPPQRPATCPARRFRSRGRARTVRARRSPTSLHSSSRRRGTRCASRRPTSCRRRRSATRYCGPCAAAAA